MISTAQIDKIESEVKEPLQLQFNHSAKFLGVV